LQCVAVCCSVLQCVAVCCSVLQCVAVCCSVLQGAPFNTFDLTCSQVRHDIRDMYDMRNDMHDIIRATCDHKCAMICTTCVT